MVSFMPKTWLVQSKPSTVKNQAKIVDSRRNFARSSGDLIGFSEILLDLVRFPLDLAEISLDSMISPQIRHKFHKNLKYFDQKLVRKFLFRQILVRLRSGQLRRVLEQRTRQPTHRSWFLGSVTRYRAAEALGFVMGGLVLVEFRSWWTPLATHIVQH